MNDPKYTAPTPERLETDSSLKSERAQTDVQFEARASSVEGVADTVIEKARERADSLVEVARGKADATLQRVSGKIAIPAAIADARASEDVAVSAQRTMADGKLAVERAEAKLAHTLVLALEREETDNRLLTERARSDHAVASRDDFLGMVSHDVRGILSMIAMSGDVLMELATEEDEPVRTEAKRIRRLTGRVARIVGDLLDVVSMETGKLKVIETEQDATVLLGETLESFQLTATAQEIRLLSQTHGAGFVAFFDHGRILQVLANLVGNALKFTARGGSISLALEPIADGLRFTVADTGCGIAEAHVESIFERFSQAAQSDHRGLGLGLFISRCIVEAHGGRIWVETALGKGSAFHFELASRQARAETELRR